MESLRNKLRASPIHARMGPYVVLLILTFVQDGLGETARYWLYVAKLLVGLWCIWQVRDLVPEMRWAISWEAVAVGILVCVIWVGLDPYYGKFSFLFAASKPWNPVEHFGAGSGLAIFFVAARTLGSALIVPPIEEIFYRSFLYRWFVRKDFERMPLNQFHWVSFIVTALIFGLVHYQWVAGILCGMSYQWLVLRKNRLGDAMTAHAITNFLLGIWIYWRDDWIFW